MVRASEISMNNKDKYKLSLVKSPFMWTALTKFLVDDNINQRFSISKDQDSFFLVHFTHVSSVPQFYEFKINKSGSSIRTSMTTEGHEIKVRQATDGLCNYLSLNDLNPYDENATKCKSNFTYQIVFSE
jgi:hypothetical protein